MATHPNVIPIGRKIVEKSIDQQSADEGLQAVGQFALDQALASNPKPGQIAELRQRFLDALLHSDDPAFKDVRERYKELKSRLNQIHNSVL